jgi:hypothetical protein
MDNERRSELTRYVIKELSNIFSLDYQKAHHPMRDYVGDSWLANMHLCYSNEYISFRTLYENEIEDILCQYCDDSFAEKEWCRIVTGYLEQLINSTSHILGDRTYERLGIMLEESIVRAALS